MAENVEVISFLMGSNKTNGIIDWMNKNSDERYIYIVPNLSELEDTELHKSRILSIGFEVPTTDGEYENKRDDLYDKLCRGVSVAFTHALYRMLERKHLDKIKEKGYIITIDEEVNLIDKYDDASTADLVSLLNDGKVVVNEDDGLVVWVAEDNVTAPYLDKNHKHHKFYRHIINEYIYTSRCTKKNGEYTNVFMTSQLTKDLISCAKRLIIITYLFQGSVLDSFLRLKGFKAVKFTDVEFKEASLDDVVSRIKLLPYDKKLQKMKQSASWWKKASAEDVKDISNFIRRTATKSGFISDEVMWTCSGTRVKGVGGKSVKNFVSPIGFTKDSNGDSLWIPCTMRATNKYAHKKLAIHCYDRYPHLSISTYLQDYGVRVDSDLYAISECLQWLFRSNVRFPNGEVTVAFGSKRMYDLYVRWTKGEFKDVF